MMATSETIVSPPKRRGHAHRRSAAILGDFDSMGIVLTPQSPRVPRLDDLSRDYSFPSEGSLSPKYSADLLHNDTSSTETTPETKRVPDTEKLLVQRPPAPVIDLDAALDFDRPRPRTVRSHRRTESAPELDAGLPPFAPPKLTINTGLGLRKSLYGQLLPAPDEPIVEEEEPDADQDLLRRPLLYSNDLSATLSASLTKESTSIKLAALLAGDDLRKCALASPQLAHVLQPPAPIGLRRARTAARYQNHYDALRLLMDALRLTESLTLQREPQSNGNVGHVLLMPLLKGLALAGRLVKPLKSLLPTRFNFELVVYDVGPVDRSEVRYDSESEDDEPRLGFPKFESSKFSEYEIKEDSDSQSKAQLHRKAHSISVLVTDNLLAKLRPKEKSHNRKGSFFSALTYFTLLALSTRTLIAPKQIQALKKETELDLLVSTPILQRIGTHLREALRDVPPELAQTLTVFLQDLPDTGLNTQLLAALGASARAQLRLLFKLSSKLSLSLSGMLKPKRKISGHFEGRASDDAGKRGSRYSKMFGWLKPKRG